MGTANRFADGLPEARRRFGRRRRRSVGGVQDVVAVSVGCLTMGETFSRIHMPAKP